MYVAYEVGIISCYSK